MAQFWASFSDLQYYTCGQSCRPSGVVFHNIPNINSLQCCTLFAKVCLN